MARIRCDFFSETLGVGTSMTVLLPDRDAAGIGMAGAAGDGDPPVLYLLHGLSDDDTAWTRRSSIERYAAPLGLAVVMPQAQRSFYCDEAHGNRYWSFLSEELPEVCRSFFRLSTRREDTFVAGLSMGGYGAVKWALRHPDRFAAAASLSGALDVVHRRNHPTSPLDPAVWHTVWGDGPAPDGDDTVALLERAGDDLPALYVACGTEDFLYEDNVRFVDTARRRGRPLTVDFGPGDHDWPYWDAQIAKVLTWLPLRGKAGPPINASGRGGGPA